VLYRSIFDLVRELLAQETQAAESRLLHHAEIIAINGRSYRLRPNPKQSPSKTNRATT